MYVGCGINGCFKALTFLCNTFVCKPKLLHSVHDAILDKNNMFFAGIASMSFPLCTRPVLVSCIGDLQYLHLRQFLAALEEVIVP